MDTGEPIAYTYLVNGKAQRLAPAKPATLQKTEQ